MFDGPIRGGTRGGAGEFKWSDVSADKDRENYLGHSINAPTGRWQKNKDVHWYNRDRKSTDAEREEELRKVKEVEADALAVALGFKPAPKPGEVKEAQASSETKEDGVQQMENAALELKAEKESKDERRLRKEERRRHKEEKRARKAARRALKHGDNSELDAGRRRQFSRSRSRSLSRSRSPRRPPRSRSPEYRGNRERRPSRERLNERNIYRRRFEGYDEGERERERERHRGW